MKLVSVGDTNLDGSINATDLQNIIDHYDPNHIKPQDWMQGDFNYDGFTDAKDLNLLMSLYGSAGSSESPITAAELGQLQNVEAAGITGSAVPEPSALAVILLGAGALANRRRRPVDVMAARAARPSPRLL